MRVALSLLVFVAGCTDGPEGPPYRAEVVTFRGFAEGSEVPRMELAVEELGVDDLDALRTASFELVRGGHLVIREQNGSWVDDGEITGGAPLDLRYDVEDGVVIARDYPTLVLLSTAHLFGRVLAALPDVTGLSVEELVARRGRFQVFFEPSFQYESDDGGFEVTYKANAFYLGGKNVIGLARRSPAEQLPFAANPMVLAHELGHAVFERTFFGGETPLPCGSASERDEDAYRRSRLGAEPMVAGLNEGFADLVAFGVTGGTNAFADNPRIQAKRSLRDDDFTYDTLSDCPGSFYCAGTLFSRALYRAFVNGGGDPTSLPARAAFVRDVTTALTAAPTTLDERGSLPPFTPALCKRTELDAVEDGKVMGAVLDAIAAGLPAASQPAVCDGFIARFGAVGFPEEARITCAR